MQIDQGPFPAAWMAFDLPGCRGCDGTYCYYDYASLPPIAEALRGDFSWLQPLDAQTEAKMQLYHRDEERQELARRFASVAAQAREHGLALPEPFARFMQSLELQDRIPSCTACYFTLPEKIVRSPAGDGYLIRFMNDQQDVLLWYLYLTPGGEHGVVVSPVNVEEPLHEQVQATPERFFGLCAGSFEEFLYRWWLENEIWFAQSDRGGALTPVQQAYVDAYRQAHTAG